MHHPNENEHGTDLAPDGSTSGLADMESVTTCAGRHTNMNNHDTRRHELDDIYRNILQSDFRQILQEPRPRLETLLKSGLSQDGQAEERICSSRINAGGMEFSFAARLGDSDAGSFPVTPRRQTPSKASTKPSPSSPFDFSAMQTEISDMAVNLKAAKPVGGQKSPNKNESIEDAAHFLQKMPFNESRLATILPTAVRARILESSEFCISLTKQGRRCKNKHKDLSNEATDILKGLASLNVQSDWKDIYPKLESIVKMLMCSQTHAKTGVKELLALDGQMTELERKRDNGLGPIRDCLLDLVEPWFEEICKNSDTEINKLREDQDQRAKAEAEDFSQETPSKAMGKSTLGLQYNLGTFLPYQPEAVRLLSIKEAIRQELEAPLSCRDLDSKHIYIYWSTGNFGLVKIGVSDDVSSRLQKWGKQCQHEVKELWREDIFVKHAYRVEKLVQTELKEVRLKVKCKGCDRSHREWFKTSSEHAGKVIRKYSSWAASMPYQFDEQSNKWGLNNNVGDNMLEDLCEPIPFPELKFKSPRRTRRSIAKSGKSAL
ncbi:hypothetical protein CPC735_021000 [Coccidioides posadasii C735 delta SOWgp]|uniref:Bacteriophage T5 Orf172 DNA-binding domain-containing protein n=1 Tax=Coccidioides posadasii (strain C735) TaxID=222929 RepID=C5PJC3_COCP7|nr:hypothetical protein CPC735_021000 [Coccidioides posadasii C735 delta SOWgp]EER23072.1 hypothetical protein CPC735_021000 [Coccidioides posadasii C735 delta SOWgp]|eukprot:XP_003065217.1 hypothetical protein CPC735_021000 [Coccidioides posadasii C735 delta SOWgp]